MIRTAYLRVYVPEQHAPASGLTQVGRGDVPVFISDLGLMVESMGEDGLRADWKGKVFVCPRTPRLRMLEGVLAVRRAYGGVGGTSVIPEETARAAAEELQALQDENPSIRPYILTSAWHVPFRWFVPFSPLVREVVERNGVRSLRYRVPHREAMERVSTALEILRRSDIPDSIISELEELGDWLSDFPAEAMVELDYGSVSGNFSDAELALDQSVEDVWDSLDALDVGDWDTAGTAYASVVSRWAPSMSVSYSN